MVKRVYRTMQGKEIDMEALANRNETMPAVGNARMNARGDELGPGGEIIRTREDSMMEYYETNPNAIPRETTKRVQAQPVEEQPVLPKVNQKKGKNNGDQG